MKGYKGTTAGLFVLSLLDRGLQKLDPGSEHPFVEPFIALHLQRAEAGNYESARWLRDNVQRSARERIAPEPHVSLWVKQMRKGDLRRSLQRKGLRGARGPALGDHRQLLLAREMWKQIHLAGRTTDAAAEAVGKGRSSALAAYYRFMKPPERRVLDFELARDCRDDPEGWIALLDTLLAASRLTSKRQR